MSTDAALIYVAVGQLAFGYGLGWQARTFRAYREESLRLAKEEQAARDQRDRRV